MNPIQSSVGVVPGARAPESVSGPASGLPLLWWVVCAALAALCVAVVGPAYVNHDAAWYLHMARRMLNGATLYRDVVDTNPPLIVLLTVPPVWLAGTTAAPAVFKAYVFCLALVSLAVVTGIVRRSWAGASGLSRGLFISALVFVALPFVKTDFGQREHLMVLMVLPYVLLATLRASDQSVGIRLAVPIGAVAGLGFAMKPHYLLAWVAIEAALASLRPRARAWLRPESVAAAAAIVAYALFVVLLVPQYLGIADTARQVYGGLNSSAALLMRLPDPQICIVAVALLALVRLPRSAWRACLVLLAAAVGFLLAALLQLKGWSYHLYPARVFLGLFYVRFAIGAIEGLPGVVAAVRGRAKSMAALVVAAMLLSSARYVLEARRPTDLDLVTPLIGAIHSYAQGGSVAMLSMRTIIYPAFPAVTYAGARWPMRHNSLWFLPGLYTKELQAPDAATRFRTPAAMSELERRLYNEVIGDLCADPPALLLIESVEPRAPAGRRALDLTAYYGQDERYRRLFAQYRRLTTVGPFTAYVSSPRAAASIDTSAPRDRLR